MLFSFRFFTSKTLYALCASTLLLSACASSSSQWNSSSAWRSQSSASSGTFKVGSPYKVGGIRYVPEETYNYTQKGIASWYGPNFHGKYTANGELYDQNALTAAHKTLQLPAIIRVTNLENGRSIIVRVNDRGPFSRGRILDMSKRGAELLEFKNQGTAKVKIQVLGEESRLVAEAAKQGQNVSGVEIALNEGKTVQEFLGLSAAPLEASDKLFETMQAQALLPADIQTLAAAKDSSPQPIIPQNATLSEGQAVAVVQTGMHTAPDQVTLQSRFAMQNQGQIVSEDLAPPTPAQPAQAQTIPAQSLVQPNPALTAQKENLLPMPAEGITAPQPTTAQLVENLVQKVPVTTVANIYVQAGSFSSQANASAYAQRLSAYGTSNVYPVSVGDKTFYRVRLGPVETVEKADTMLTQLADAGENQAIIIVGD